MQIPKAISQEGNIILQNNETALCDNRTVLREVNSFLNTKLISMNLHKRFL